MDVQLKEIIDRIKHDGMESAQEEAARIISGAREEASAIVQKAEEDAERIRTNMEAKIQRMENSGRDALRQAGRDLMLMLKERIKSVFDRLLEREVRDALNAKLLEDVIVVAVENVSKQERNEIDVLIPAKLSDEIEPVLMAKLSAEFASGIEIKPFKGLDAGFRIAIKDGSAFYDFSDREISAMLGRYLNPRLAKLLSS